MVGCEHLPHICQAPLRRQLFKTAVCTYFFESTIVSTFVYGMDPQVAQSLDDIFFHLCATISLYYSREYFVAPSKKDQNTHILVILLELQVVCELYLG